MPTIQIEVRQQYPQAVGEQLLNSVFQCVKTAFQLPEYDRNIRLVVHEAHRFQYMSHLAQPEYFTLISIDCFAGRSLETKCNLYKQMVKSLGGNRYSCRSYSDSSERKCIGKLGDSWRASRL